MGSHYLYTMGEMAEAIIDGIFDEFGDYNGKEFYHRDKKPQSRFIKKSKHPRKEKFSPKESVFGILKVIFLRVQSTTTNFMTCEICHDVMKEYVEKSLLIKVRSRKKLEFCRELIDQDFNKFMKWLNENYPPNSKCI